MAKKRRTRPGKAKPEERPGWGFVLGGTGIGLAFAAAGFVVLRFGGESSGAAGQVTAKSVSSVGYWMIALGVAAMALTLAIRRWGR